MRFKALTLLVLMISFTIAAAVSHADGRPLVGAIRWDAWIGDWPSSKVGALGVGQQVERALGPSQFHDRVPFFGKITGPDSVQVREQTQDVMDKEIQYAHDAGIDYWAFDWYAEGSGLDTARHLYLSSKLKDKVKYCFISYPPRDFPTLINFFKDPDYLKVLGGRPVLYLFQSNYSPEDLQNLRDQTMAAGLANPYIIAMELGSGGGHTVGCAFDGDLRTYWQAATGRYAGEYAEVNFGAPVTFNKVILAEEKPTTTGFEIQDWDGKTWQTVATGTAIGQRNAPTTLTFLPVTATEARILFTAGTGQPELDDMEIYGDATGSTDLATGRTYLASSTGYNYDALSHYVTGARDGAPFTAVMDASEKRWDHDKTFGPNVVPNVTAGADPRPRILNPVTWTKYLANGWSQEPTPDELGAHMKQALDWLRANKASDPANMLIIYAWNEFDEGGWICPTLSGGTDRLDAIHKALATWKGR